jgi:hypothetical protein
MKLLFGKSGKEAKVKSQEEKTILFVCVENAARSLYVTRIRKRS